MKRIIISFGWLMAACVAIAGTGTSNEFRLDCRTGVRTAALTEKIQYSTAWATNLTAAQQGEAKAVVKVNPCLKTPPKYLVVDMSGGRSAARWPVSYLDEVPSGGWTDEYKTEKLVLRYIPAGSFIMGGRATDYPGAVNTNLHMVTLTKPFYIGVFECTQRQWELAMGTRPSFFTNETCYATRPVDRVSYSEIRGQNLGLRWPTVNAVDEDSFLDVIRRKSGLLGLDLPTDAQWEYACRAGSATSLNTGVNLSNEIGDYACAEIMDAARFGGNSDYPRMVAEGIDCKGVTDAKCSAKVGSYRPNAWGLYDMHGNLWERCLDRATEVPLGSKDPVGSSDETIVRRMIRGGGYNELAWRCTSGFRYSDINGMGYLATAHGQTVGFRICLHDATVYPSADSATVLINASGAAAADWTPTRAGTYQLTHEVQVDGVTVAPMESALFRVDGPELKIVPMGELTNGVAVKVEKVGGGGEWTVYYSLDGSEPTAGSTKYEGPFALPASATVKAVAISPSGVSSEVASKELVLSPALAVEDAKARQRYPWNGKVDIDCEITGDATKKYRVSFSVSDEIGKTNLTIKTVSIHSTPTPTTYTSSPSSEFVLPPGKYRFVWDAAADLPKGTRFGGVSVSIDAEPSPLADWKRVVEITVDGYAGSETLTDVPVLVRLSSAIEGFDYADFAAPDTGADMIFTDMDGVARYPYEIDEWHQDGESLVWVKLPELRKGTKFKLAYGNSKLITLNSQLATHEVWSDYAGVWHMNEDSGTAFDSTEHGLDALPSCGTNKLADISQMVAYENGACGRARVNAIELLSSGNYLETPSYDALRLGDRFVVSGWFLLNVNGRAEPLVMRDYKSNSRGDHACQGWCVEHCTNRDAINVMGATNHNQSLYFTCDAALTSKWSNVTIIYAGDNAVGYVDGARVAEGQILPPTDNGLPMTFGSGAYGASGGNQSLSGQYDEIRLRGGSLSADRIKADYDMIANRDFLRYGPVENGKGNQDSNGNSAGGGQPVVVPLAAPANVLENSRQIDCTDLVWDAVPGATGYEIWVSATPNGTIDGAAKILTVTEPSFFDDDHTYAPARHNIWIRAVDDHGNVSAFVGPFNVGIFVS